MSTCVGIEQKKIKSNLLIRNLQPSMSRRLGRYIRIGKFISTICYFIRFKSFHFRGYWSIAWKIKILKQNHIFFETTKS